MLQRLKEYIDYKGVSTSRFEKSIGMSNASFGKSLKNNGTIGADKLEIILNVYADLDLYWLVTGKGEMIKSYESNAIPSIVEEKPPNFKSIQVYEKRIRTQEETIETLQRYIRVLEDKLNKKQMNDEVPEEPGQKRKAG
jgi:hypothetical protein